MRWRGLGSRIGLRRRLGVGTLPACLGRIGLADRQPGLVGVDATGQRLGHGLGMLRCLDHRQLVERSQAQVVEELARGGVERRATDRLAVADDLDPAAVLELLEDHRVDGHPADVLHVAAGHGLAVGNDGQRLESGARVAGRLLRVQAIQVVAHLGPALEAPAGGDVDQFQAALRPVVLHLVQQRLDGVGAEFVVEQHAQFAQGQRLGRTDQGGFKNALRIRRIHGSRCPGRGAARGARSEQRGDRRGVAGQGRRSNAVRARGAPGRQDTVRRDCSPAPMRGRHGPGRPAPASASPAPAA